MTADEALAATDAFDARCRELKIDSTNQAGRVLAAEVRRLRAMLEWQPIETARFDDRVELSFPATTSWPEFRRIERVAPWHKDPEKFRSAAFPTHWRPIGPGPGEPPCG